jgi:hypothetical protein
MRSHCGNALSFALNRYLADDHPDTARGVPRQVRPHDPVFPASRLRIALETAFAAVAAIALACILYRVWNLRWAVPINEDESDTRFIAAQLKTIEETGWWLHNPKLNFPYGQFHADFPMGGESLQLVVLKLLMWITPGYGQAINVYYLGGFGVLAAVTFLCVRHLRFAFPIALVVALVYTNLAYHFSHAEMHLYRSTYFTAPLAALLLLWSLSWRTRFLEDPDPRSGVRWWRNLRRARVAATLGLAVVIGISESIMTAFTMALLGAAAIVAAVRWREPQRLAVAGVLIAVLAGSFFVVSAPTVVRIAIEGKNPYAGQRGIAESESFALKISRLVLPPSNHRIEALGRMGNQAQIDSLIPSEGGQYLGVLAIAGFMGGLIGILGHGLRGPPRRDLRRPEDREALTDHASLLMVLCVLLGTVAGFSTVLGLAGFGQVRTWARIEIILALLALIVCSVWFERFGGWLRQRLRRPAPVITLITVVVAAIALLDGIPSMRVNYHRLTASWVSDQRFVDSIEKRMPDGAAIFELPVIPFPESPPQHRMIDYDLYRGYVHDDGSLQWSYGGVKGRPVADWQFVFLKGFDVNALPALLGMGYDGVWVDTFGYADGGAKLRGDLQRATRTKPLESENHRLLFFDLSAYKKRLGRSEAELDAIARRVLGFDPADGPPGS